jgi:hypothetical protein
MDPTFTVMCGRIIQSSPPFQLAIAEGLDGRGSRFHDHSPRWNGAPSQELLVIRRNHHTGEVSLDPLRWRLIPYWCEDHKGGRKPINAKCETVRTLPTFRDAYRRRDGFFEWALPQLVARRVSAPTGSPARRMRAAQGADAFRNEATATACRGEGRQGWQSRGIFSWIPSNARRAR